MNNQSIQHPRSTRRGNFHLPTARVLCVALAAMAVLCNTRTATAANIVWVSDANDPATGFFPAGSGYTDSGFVTLLQNAGHNVIRFNQPNAQATLLTAAEIIALNTNDLIIIGRCVNSGAFQPPQGDQWNTAITKPLIDMSPYHVRTEGPNRLGWFAGNTSDNFDDTPTVLNAVLTGNPVTDAVVDYLFAGVTMKGTNTVLPYDEAVDRNTSHIAGAPVAGGIAYATANYIQQNNTANPPTMNFGNAIVGFPAGTAVRYGTNILAGYRMFFAGGSREGTAYPQAIPLYAGRESLTPSGEDIFLRAVQVAINSGVAPATDPLAPPSIVAQPASVTVNQGGAASFVISVGGAAPRTVQWQRDTGDGVTFTNIPDASSPFRNSRLALPVVGTEDNNAKFRAEVSNANGTLSSDTVTLTVTPDTEPPVALSAASLDGMTIGVCFDEPVDSRGPGEGGTAVDPFNYTLTDPNDPLNAIVSVQIRPDGRTLVLSVTAPLSSSFTVNVARVEDRHGHAISDAGIDLAGTHLNFAAVEIGTPGPSGTNYACDASSFVVGGGATTGGSGTLANDIQPTTEHYRFAYRSVSGDFDARVRVISLTGTPDHLETTAKAMLSARASTDAPAQSVNAFVTPSYPGDATYWATARTTAGAATSSNIVAVPYGLNAVPVTYPAWLRLVRAGDAFTTYRSANGTDWTALGSITIAMGPSALVGVGAASHRNGRLAFGTFSNFSISQTPPSPTLMGLTYAAGSFTASFQTQNGVTYTVQYKDDLNAASWTTLTTVTGDGTVKSFTGPGPAVAHRFYQVIVP